MSKEIVHALVLIVAIAITFIFSKTNLAQYDLQITAILFIILYLTKKLLPQTGNRSRLTESVVFTLVILLIINTTGGISSPFFFLVYFLLFSLSLLLEPIISLTTTIALIALFLFSLPSNQSFSNLIPILSLAFISPFAMFLGKEYLEIERLKVIGEKEKENTFLFLSLMIKNHLKNIKQDVENFLGDHQLNDIKKNVREMERLIEKFEQ